MSEPQSSTRPTVAYAPQGLIGVLTPQANTTVEPEFSVLTPPGFAYINARLTSDKLTIEQRLVDYAQGLEGQLKQFANAPIDAVAFAATGASYLIGREAEDALIERLARDRKLPLITAATAVCAALETLGAKTISLVSPYPDDLTQRSVDYWGSRNFKVAEVASAYEDVGGFHPIYTVSHEHAAAVTHKLSRSNADAIVMLGTGMPTLAVIAASADTKGPPLLSCMLALVWRSVVAAAGHAPERQQLEAWLGAEHWRQRL